VSGGLVAVVAHPDDESLIAGGTLALAARAGARTGVVSLTRGELGPSPDDIGPERLAEVREEELRRAAAALGVGWARCLRQPDGELPWSESAPAELTRLLEEELPAAILTFGPDGLYEHPDHVATSRIARAAAEAVGVAVYEAAWHADAVPALVAAARARGLPVGLWGIDAEAFGVPDPRATLEVDVSTVLHLKLAALRAHRSQLDDGHLLARLPDDLARDHLSSESWRLVGASGPGPLPALIDG
jgi:LmbE family N-acetylglucosaminyl deacetylase